jgi:non-ribosomal peptide synthetase component F
MMTLYVAVLWNWCRQNDFVLPLNIAGRQSEHKSVIGYFSYILLVRVKLSGEERFTELLARLGNEFFSCLSHPDFGRMATRHPELLSGTVFQWMTWHPGEGSSTSADAASDSPHPRLERVSVRDFGEGLTIVPPGMTAVEVTFFDTAEGLYASGSYRADRFTTETMERFMADLRAAAERFVRDPDAPIAALSRGGGGVDGIPERAIALTA